jgi:hypothetical protein
MIGQEEKRLSDWAWAWINAVLSYGHSDEDDGYALAAWQRTDPELRRRVLAHAVNEQGMDVALELSGAGGAEFHTDWPASHPAWSTFAPVLMAVLRAMLPDTLRSDGAVITVGAGVPDDPDIQTVSFVEQIPESGQEVGPRFTVTLARCPPGWRVLDVQAAEGRVSG